MYTLKRQLRPLTLAKLACSVLACLAFGSFETAESAEPRLISDSAKAEKADRALVLVHGLLGSPSESFGSWPNIIADDRTDLPTHGQLSDFAVYVIDYQSDFSSRAKLDDVAIGVARDFEASDIFKRHRHIWLVAHSMGGLVLKRTIGRWTLENKTVLLDRIMGIGMLGVPSAGAPLADLARKYSIDAIATTFGWNGVLVQDLTTNGGSYLDGLESDWMAVKRNRDVLQQRRFTPIISCGFETKPEFARSWWNSIFFDFWSRFFGADIDTIVPKLFTSSACDERRGFSVGHTDLIKPNSKRDSVHIWLRDLIVKTIVAGNQEQRVAITTSPLSPRGSGPSAPVDFNLYDKVEFSNDELSLANLDLATSLPKHPERIVYANDQTKQLASQFVLRGGPFYGSTKLQAWEAVATKNTCLKVGHSSNRLTITFSIEDQLTKQCANGAMVCVAFSCD